MHKFYSSRIQCQLIQNQLFSMNAYKSSNCIILLVILLTEKFPKELKKIVITILNNNNTNYTIS